MRPLSPHQERRRDHVLEALRVGVIDRAEALWRLRYQLGLSAAEAEGVLETARSSR